MRRALTSVLFVFVSSAFGQWADVKRLGSGGEPFVASDGTGNVYVTCHQPCQLFVSRDGGAAFQMVKQFDDGLGDLHVIAPGPNRMHVVYMFTSVNGLQVWNSSDAAKTLERGGSVKGPLDREWLAASPTNPLELYLNYSDGYIGGPKSKGVFLSRSDDGGKSFGQVSRIDNEPEGSYAVDPYLTTTGDGTLVGMWAASTDYNRIDAYKTATSSDGGKTWSNHQTLGNVRKDLGDAQERWMLGGITSSGKSTVVAWFMDYQTVSLGVTMSPLVVMYRVSTDAGKTWSPAKRITAMGELTEAIDGVKALKEADGKPVLYRQTLPWMTADPYGRIHVVYTDNRAGQGEIDGKPAAKWHVRYAVLDDLTKGFVPSERLSKDYVAGRPPLDFIGCAADKERVYATWVETPGAADGWRFSGELWFGRKPISPPAKE
ncbi:MAG TPA: hypothetical protein PLH94_01000 [Fimbriimonadaceae bacterium]|nr:hypothetical protein [Fimbriimonadaceae bacterium]